MNCKQVRNLFSAYCEGELEEAARTGMVEHLSKCAECRQALETFEQMHGDLQSAAPTPPPRDLYKTVQARLKEKSPSGSLRSPISDWFKMPRPLITATALGVLIFAVVYLPEQQEHSMRRPSKPPAIEEAQDSGTARLERKKSVVYEQRAAKMARPAATKPSVNLTLHWAAARPGQDAAAAVGSDMQEQVSTSTRHSYGSRQLAPPPETATGRPPRAAPAPRPMAADHHEAELAKETPLDEPQALGEPAHDAQAVSEPTQDEGPSGLEAEHVVRQVVERARGRIVASHVSEDSPAVHTLTIALPSANYPELLTGLRQWGLLEAPSQITAKQGEIVVQLDIKAPF